MPESSSNPSEQSRSPGPSRQRPPVRSRPSAPHYLGRPPPSSPIYPAPSLDPQNSPTGSSSGYPGTSPHLSSRPSFRQRHSFAEPQYAMSHAQPQMNMAPYPPQYTYPHPNVHGQDPNMPHLAYLSPSVQPILQQHTPLYSFQGPHAEGGSTPQLPFANSGHPSLSHMSGNPSPALSPSSPQSAHTTPQIGPPNSAAYASPGSFSPLGYSTPAPFAYVRPSSFAPAQAMYGSQYGPPPYPQSYNRPNNPDGQGTWWYIPAGGTTSPGSYESMQQSFQSNFNLGYPSVGQQDESYPQAEPSGPSAPSPISSRGPQPSSRFGAPPRELPLETAPQLVPKGSAPQAKVPDGMFSLSDDFEPQQVRRAYHPNPPAQRSEWVMWAGNIPSDATHDELWRFFNQPLSAEEIEALAGQDQTYGGLSSIFLISRSNCAFVNFESERHLNVAISRFNGKAIRQGDSRCPRLACRIRRTADDLLAGVGAQRGIGMHMRWIKEQRAKERADLDAANVTGSTTGPSFPSVPEDEGKKQRDVVAHSNSSGSFTSTNSSLFTRYFPRRYFILKSLSQVCFASLFRKNSLLMCLL